MELAADEEAVLPGGDLALAADADAAGVADDVADHVLGRVAGRSLLQVLHVHLAPADRPLGYVVRPDVGRHRGGGFAVAEEGRERNEENCIPRR